MIKDAMGSFLPILADAGTSSAAQASQLLTQLGVSSDQQHTAVGDLSRAALQFYFDIRLPVFAFIIVLGLAIALIDGIILGAFDRTGERRKNALSLMVDILVFGVVFLIFPYLLPILKITVDYFQGLLSSTTS
jgi:hypothetical protein